MVLGVGPVSDIVERLRRGSSAIYAAVEEVAARDVSHMMKEAADEIERLRVYATKLHWALVDIRDNAFVYSADRIAEKAAAPLEPLE